MYAKVQVEIQLDLHVMMYDSSSGSRINYFQPKRKCFCCAITNFKFPRGAKLEGISPPSRWRKNLRKTEEDAPVPIL